MNIDKKQVSHVAKLARLWIEESEKERWCEHLSAIVTFADKLGELNLNKTETPNNTSGNLINVFREDVCEDSFPRDVMLLNAPSQYDGCYVVPKTVE